MPLDEDVDDQGVNNLNKNIKELVGEGEALDSFSAKPFEWCTLQLKCENCVRALKLFLAVR